MILLKLLAYVKHEFRDIQNVFFDKHLASHSYSETHDRHVFSKTIKLINYVCLVKYFDGLTGIYFCNNFMSINVIFHNCIIIYPSAFQMKQLHGMFFLDQHDHK